MENGRGSLLENLRAGWRFAVLRPVAPGEFRASADQLARLAVLHLLLMIACTALLVEAPLVFDATALHSEAFSILYLLFFAHVAARWAGEPGAALHVAVPLLATDLWLAAVYTALIVLAGLAPAEVGPWLFAPIWWAVWLWGLLITTRALRMALPMRAVGAAAIAVLFAIWGLAIERVAPRSAFWWTDEWSDEETGEGHEAKLDAEAALHAQAGLLARASAALKPERPGVTDLYFVAFGSDSTQDVFLREVRYARDLFDRRFDTTGRSLVLANHRSTLEELPLASGSNLGAVLRSVGKKMNLKEDVLFLFLTGHGSRQHELAVRFPPFPLNPVDPALLARLLEESGIRNRVVVVSACYSGGFVDALKGEDTLVVTAAASDRRSFGCSNEADFTYFGEALFGKALEESRSFEGAFESARARVSARERAEDKEPSQPQLAAGDRILRRLAVLERRLPANGLGDVACRWCSPTPRQRGH